MRPITFSFTWTKMSNRIIKGKEKRNNFILMTINWMFSSCKLRNSKYSNLRTNRLHFSLAESWKGFFFLNFVRRVFNRLYLCKCEIKHFCCIFFSHFFLAWNICSLFTSKRLKKSHRSRNEISVFSWACWISISNKINEWQT